MANNSLDFSKFGKLKNSAEDVSQSISKSIDRGSMVKDVKTGFTNLVEDFSQGFATASEMASDFVAGAVSSLDEVDPSIVNQGDVPEGTEMSNLGKQVTRRAEQVVGPVGRRLKQVGDLVKAGTGPVGANFLNDLAFGRAQIEGLESGGVLTEGGKKVAKELLIDNGLLKKGKATVGKEVYDKLGGGISVNQNGGSSASEIIKKLAEGDPENEVKLILGRYTGYIDENGDVIVEDKFNYNDFKNPLDGKKYNSEQYEQAIAEGKFTELEVLLSIIEKSFFSEDDSFNYEKVRALGFVLGSKDYVDDSRDEGRNFKINLGPAPK
mgnify:CR=1 FL=1